MSYCLPLFLSDTPAAADLARQLNTQSRQFAAQSDSLIAADPSLAGLGRRGLPHQCHPRSRGEPGRCRRPPPAPDRLRLGERCLRGGAQRRRNHGGQQPDGGPALGRHHRPVPGHPARQFRRALAFGPDGHVLAVLDGYPGSTRLWDLTSGAPRTPDIKDTVSGTAPVCSADGRTLAVAGSDGVSIWDAASGRLRTTIPAPTGPLRLGDGAQPRCGASPSRRPNRRWKPSASGSTAI